MPAGRRARSIGATAYTSTSPAMSTKGRRSATERREAPRRAPAMHTAGKTRLRILGTGVTLVPSVQAEAAKDLGVALVFDVRDGLAAQQQAVMHPQDFDVYDQWFNSLDLVWSSRSVQPIEAARMDAALAAQTSGLARFAEIGNMTLREIDTLIDILIRKKESGHFRGFWGSPAESERLMAAGEVVLESMWSPTLTALRGKGMPVIEASPREGYRAWHGGMCLSARADGRVRDAAYEYMNWWLSGWAGAVMARQGYYISVPKRVKQHLTPEEWDFWYEGNVAETDMRGPSGEVIARKGEARNGGSYWRRVGNIAVWNSAMDEHNYLVRRWNEFLSA
jgi:putative spermidine/putrescine transport system substrate-binding protein